jgi:hypothetical protein
MPASRAPPGRRSTRGPRAPAPASQGGPAGDVEDLRARVNDLYNVVLLSDDPRRIEPAMRELCCVAVFGRDCVDTLSMPSKYTFGFEMSRCLIPTRALQLIKQRHMSTPRWTIIAPWYAHLFNTLYQDIHPSTDVIAESDDNSDHVHCLSISKPLVKQTLDLLKKERSALAGIGST